MKQTKIQSLTTKGGTTFSVGVTFSEIKLRSAFFGFHKCYVCETETRDDRDPEYFIVPLGSVDHLKVVSR